MLMESKKLHNISIDIPNYNGPLEVLLDLAKTQKVDLSEISITKLADQFLNFIKSKKDLNLVPFLIEVAEQGGTVGEIVEVMKKVYGEWEESFGI